MVLANAKGGGTVVIVALNTSRHLTERLYAMGLIPGASLKVVRASRSGEMILGCLDGRFALGRALTKQIEVS